MKLSDADNGLIMDICLNQDSGSFVASDVIDQISQDYGIEFTLDEVGAVICDLHECGMLEPDRCDKTIDLFSGQPDAKKPLCKAACL